MKRIIFLILASILIYFSHEGELESDSIEKKELISKDKMAKKDKPSSLLANEKVNVSHHIKKDQKVLLKDEIKPLVFDIELAFESTDYYDAFLTAYKNGNAQVVVKLGENLLKIPDRYSKNFWYGNLCHAVHILMGKTYLSANNVEKAEYHLVKSVDNECIKKSVDLKYSPQLSSFGPDRSLAFSLYKIGKRDSVIRFLKLTKKFWDLGVEEGIIDKAITNVLTTELSYEQLDDPNFPFKPVAYVIDYESAPMK